MSAAEIHTYQYLWEGSQPGWVLTRLNGNYVDLLLKFELGGPSTPELMAVRRSVQEFKSMPLNQIIEQLRGCSTYSLGRFESKEASRVAASCVNENLNVVEEIIDVPKFLPINKITNSVLLIEDNELAERGYESALQHGISVRQVEF